MAKTLDELELRALLDPHVPAPRVPSPYTENARYLTSLDGFNIKHPAIPPHVFRAERDRVLAPGAPTGLVPLDLSTVLGLGYPATTPFILSRFARIRAGETLATEFRASTELYHVIRGSGTTWVAGGEPMAWQAADTFCLPGGVTARHAASGDTVLWITTNEPQLQFEELRPPAPGASTSSRSARKMWAGTAGCLMLKPSRDVR